jgi:Mg2+ and Co2+ transporter CorA
MKRLLVGMRKTITPQRDAFTTLTGRIAELPGFDSEDENYFRDVYDHLIRISDLIDSYRDLLSSAMDVYMSTVVGMSIATRRPASSETRAPTRASNSRDLTTGGPSATPSSRRAVARMPSIPITG